MAAHLQTWFFTYKSRETPVYVQCHRDVVAKMTSARTPPTPRRLGQTSSLFRVRQVFLAGLLHMAGHALDLRV